ncbi:MAG: GldG family protein [Burkholderiales bacterium]|nr:GldG family protein [Burkholderiales bacterium]
MPESKQQRGVQRVERRRRAQHALRGAALTLLFVFLIGALALLADQHRLRWDITQNARNTLSAETRNIVQRLDGPIDITAYAAPGQDARLGDLRKLIGDFVAPYQAAKPNIELRFVDPKAEPQAASAAGVKANGELVVQYGQKSEHLTTFTEQALTNLLVRLARSQERLVTYLDGHGERKLNGVANHDLGEFGKQLEARGFKTAALNLSLAQEVPDNVAALIIASPRVDLLPAEVTKLNNYIARGGALLWLIDQEPLHGLEAVAERLQLRLTEGIVVDPAAAELNVEATMAVGSTISSEFGKHPVTRDFTLNTVFPFARQIATETGAAWQTTPLVQVAPRGWLETGALDQTISFDAASDKPGPIIVAMALSRPLGEQQKQEQKPKPGQEQRIAVVGSGHFLANAYVGLGGNLEIGVNLINWLARDDNLIVIQPPARIDSDLNLARTAQVAIVVIFLIALPLAFLIAGGVIRWRRRRG